MVVFIECKPHNNELLRIFIPLVLGIWMRSWSLALIILLFMCIYPIQKLLLPLNLFFDLPSNLFQVDGGEFSETIVSVVIMGFRVKSVRKVISRFRIGLIPCRARLFVILLLLVVCRATNAHCPNKFSINREIFYFN